MAFKIPASLVVVVGDDASVHLPNCRYASGEFAVFTRFTEGPKKGGIRPLLQSEAEAVGLALQALPDLVTLARDVRAGRAVDSSWLSALLLKLGEDGQDGS